MSEPVGPETFRRLVEAAESGQLYLEPDATENCVKACDTFLEALQFIRNSCSELEVSARSGTCPPPTLSA